MAVMANSPPPPAGCAVLRWAYNRLCITICMSVCLSVCLSLHWRISKTTLQTSLNLLYALSWAVARSSSDSSGICYLLQVLWMTSCFPIMGPMAHSLSNIYASAVLEQIVINFQRIRQGALHCLTLSSYICNSSELLTGSVSDDDMRGAAVGWWPAACGIKAGGEVCFPRLPCCCCCCYDVT